GPGGDGGVEGQIAGVANRDVARAGHARDGRRETRRVGGDRADGQRRRVVAELDRTGAGVRGGERARNRVDRLIEVDAGGGTHAQVAAAQQAGGRFGHGAGRGREPDGVGRPGGEGDVVDDDVAGVAQGHVTRRGN